MSLIKYHYDKYQKALASLPPSGGGGCHTALLGVSNHGVYAGIDPQQIHDDLRQRIYGTRRVHDREITAVIEKSLADKGKKADPYNFKKRQQKPLFNGEKARQKIITKGAGRTEADIWDSSPIRIDWPHEEDPLHLLKHLYQSNDLLFMGERYSSGRLGKTIRTASEWQQYFSRGGQTFPHIIPNPLSGQEAPTQNGKASLRADACVKSFRFAVVEFDNLSRKDQFDFWWGANLENLPVVCLIDSGNKSIHGWIRIDGVTDGETWTQEVENILFRQLLQPLGVDGACRNEARLSRLPGHRRENGKMQRLIYLAPSGRRVSG